LIEGEYSMLNRLNATRLVFAFALAPLLAACGNLELEHTGPFSDEAIQQAALAAISDNLVAPHPIVVTRVQPWGILGPTDLAELVFVLEHMNQSAGLDSEQLFQLAQQFMRETVSDYSIDAPARHTRVSPVIRQGSLALVECSTSSQQFSGVSTLVLLSTEVPGKLGRPRLLVPPMHDGVTLAHPLVSLKQALYLAPKSAVEMVASGPLEIGPDRQLIGASDFTVGVKRSSYDWRGYIGGYGSGHARGEVQSTDRQLSYEEICDLYHRKISSGRFEHRHQESNGGSSSLLLYVRDKETRKQIGILEVRWRNYVPDPKILPSRNAEAGPYAAF